jgi:hypothetical protein
MPQVRKRTSNRGTDNEVMKQAAEICIKESKSIRLVVKDFDICYVSLTRYIIKFWFYEACTKADFIAYFIYDNYKADNE